MDWCNDTNSQGHTVMTRMSDLFDSAFAQKQGAHTANTRQMTYWENDLNVSDNQYKQGGRPDSCFWLPYFGFSTNITNYNQLWTSLYDSYVDTIRSYDASTEYWTDGDGKKHLWISAGAPIVEMQQENNYVTIDVKFDDDNDHDIWFNVGAFKKNVKPNNENCIDRSTIYVGDINSKTLATAAGSTSTASTTSYLCATSSGCCPKGS